MRNFGQSVALSMEFATGCIDECHVRYYRRLFTRHGGVFREVYGRFGVFWQVTFRSWNQLVKVAEILAQKWNEWIIDDALKSGTSVAKAMRESGVRWDQVCRVYSFVPPVEKFEVINCIHSEERRRALSHPIRG